MNIELGLLIGLCSTMLGMVLGVLNYKRGTSKDIKTDAAGDAELKTDIKYIARGIEDIRVDMKTQERRHSDLSERVTRVEESSKSAHRRLDCIENGGN